MSVHLSRSMNFRGAGQPVPSSTGKPIPSDLPAPEPVTLPQSETGNALPEAPQAPPKNLSPNTSKDAFSHFLRYTTPTPPPTKARFYWDEFKANFWTSMALGQARYKDSLRNDRYTRLKAVLVTVLFGLGYAVFRRLRRTFSYLLMLGMLAGPIKDANRIMPQLAEAYEQVKRGNPTQGRATFQIALDDSVYSLMNDFMKPLTFGMALGLILSFPSMLRGEGKGFMIRSIRILGKALGIRPTQKPLAAIDRFIQPAITWGDGVCNQLRRKLPFLKWLEM